MNNQKLFTTFSKLLSYYRNARGLSFVEMKSHLENLNYHISISTLHKYESGESFPPPAFVVACRYFLHLNEDQFMSLTDAIVGDIIAQQTHHYKNAVDELERNGKFGSKKTNEQLKGLRARNKHMTNVLKEHVTTMFLSYSRNDEKVTKLIAKHLKQAGIECWLDQKEIALGEPILDRIREGIAKESEYVLIILSKHSMNSEWCKLELRMAYDKEIMQKRIIVIPVKIDDTDVSQELRVKRYFELNPKSLYSVKTLIREIENLIKKQNTRR